jgi:competence protein ComEC
MGDAEETSETEILKGTNALKSDVLKVGHHGSSSSSTEAFLEAVAPDMCVISVAKENDYGHPHREVIERLEKLKIKTYQTSTSGTIVMKTDGETIIVTETALVDVNNASVKNQPAEYIGNKNSKVFHLPACKSLPAEHNRVILNSRGEAINGGYKPCKNCKP